MGSSATLAFASSIARLRNQRRMAEPNGSGGGAGGDLEVTVKVAIPDGTNNVQWVRSVAERLHNFARDQVAGDGGAADVSTTMSLTMGTVSTPVALASVADPKVVPIADAGPVLPDEPTCGLVLHASRRIVLVDGVEAPLTRLEYDLLLFLVEHGGRVFTRGQLLNHVWGYPDGCGQRTVDVHIRRLRAKLCGSGPTISTVRGVGYRLDHAHRVRVVTEA